MGAFAILNLLIIWEVRQQIAEGYGDFASFYTAGKILQRGQAARLYDRSLQWQIQQEFASRVKIRTAPLPYIRPPFEAAIFYPLAYLSYPTAFVVWTAVKIAILVGFPFLLPKDVRLSGSAAAEVFQGFLCLGFFPVAFDLLQGQDSILLLLVVTLMFWFLQRGQDLASGVMLGLGLFKFHLIIPMFLVFLVRRKFKFALGFSVAAAMLAGISMALVGWDGLREYPRYLWQINQAPWLGGFKSYAMPDIRGLLTPLLGRGSVSPWAQVILLAVTAMGVIVVAWLWSDSPSLLRDRAGISLCLVTTILCSYYANSYDLTLLLLVLALGGTAFRQEVATQGWARYVFVISAAVLLLSPVYWILALVVDQFAWSALVLFPLVFSLASLLNGARVRSSHAEPLQSASEGC